MRLATKYSHHDVEKDKYDFWVSNKLFETHDMNKPPFTIILPPPNVTGKLHIGHACDGAIQDLLIRLKKMQGYDTLYLAGMDHAGIATQAKVEERLRNLKINKYDIGREEFIKKTWEWKDEYASLIREQWKTLGLGLDYSKEVFTLDDKIKNAVLKVFTDLYNKGLIYRDNKIINWDPVAKTALSNIEVIHKDIRGAEHYFKYYFENEEEYLTIMTTRPETIFGDSAIAVNPKDPRYKSIVGKNVVIPISGRVIPVITDEYVNIDLGSGCVKITPAHDPNDFEVGKRHDLEQLIIMSEDGSMSKNEYVTKEFQGLDRFEARKLFIKTSQKEGTFIELKEIIHSVGHSERTDAIVEPYLSLQWFIKMKELAEKSINNQQSDPVNFYPPRFEKTFTNWMENVEDWCISRQLWWGHRIPAWYHKETGEIYVGASPGNDYYQDEDVLDTWFSSALWPYATLGWPEKTSDFEKYFPNSVLVTGYDIIFFWVARMIFTALEFTNQKPFDNVLIHGLIRDPEGRKMSKSLGNGVDPMDVVSQYGADALRFFLTTNATLGQDFRYSEEKIDSSANFINKLWNAAKFVQMHEKEEMIEPKLLINQYILESFNNMILEVTPLLEKYEFGLVGNIILKFVWDDFCANYIELSKTDINNKETIGTLYYMLNEIIRLLHPFIPFVTEEIHQKINKTDQSILLENYPIYKKEFTNFSSLNKINILFEIIKKTREARKEFEIKNKEIIEFYFESDEKYFEIIHQNLPLLKKMVNIEYSKIEGITYPLNNNISLVLKIKKNYQKEIQRINEEIVKMEKEIIRSKSMLTNDNFVSRAKKEKVMEEQEKLNDYESKLKSLFLELKKYEN